MRPSIGLVQANEVADDDVPGVDGMAMRPMSRPLDSGDLITTGTVTRAFPVAPGERWTSAISGLPLAGMDVRFSA